MSERFCNQCATPLSTGGRLCPTCASLAAEAGHAAGFADYPDDTSGCGLSLLTILLVLVGIGLIMFGLMLAGVALGPSTPEPLLVVGGLGAVVVGLVFFVLARRVGNACPKCGRWGTRTLDGRESTDKHAPSYYHCSACAHRWREGFGERPSPPEAS